MYVRLDDAASMLVCLLAALVANLLDCKTCSSQSKLHDRNGEELILGHLVLRCAIDGDLARNYSQRMLTNSKWNIGS